MGEKLLRIRVTLKGRPVRALAFNKDCITVGRDPGADIYLDNPGISREHCRILLASNGLYKIKDLGSANGMFVNDKQVDVHHIINNDVVFVGKFALWFCYDEDRRGEQNAARRLASTQDEGTTVLRTTELNEMIEGLRVAESSRPADPVATRASSKASVTAQSRRTRSLVVLGLLVAFAAGYVAGGGLRWIPWRGALRGAIPMVRH
jgi:hypothetical protein